MTYVLAFLIPSQLDGSSSQKRCDQEDRTSFPSSPNQRLLYFTGRGKPLSHISHSIQLQVQALDSIESFPTIQL